MLHTLCSQHCLQDSTVTSLALSRTNHLDTSCGSTSVEVIVTEREQDHVMYLSCVQSRAVSTTIDCKPVCLYWACCSHLHANAVSPYWLLFAAAGKKSAFSHVPPLYINSIYVKCILFVICPIELQHMQLAGGQAGSQMDWCDINNTADDLRSGCSSGLGYRLWNDVWQGKHCLSKYCKPAFKLVLKHQATAFNRDTTWWIIETMHTCSSLVPGFMDKHQ